MWWWFVAMGWAAEPGGAVPMCAPERVAVPHAEDSTLAGLKFAVRVRRAVNARWKSNLDALSPSQYRRLQDRRRAKPQYATSVAITLDSEGRLTGVCLEARSGVRALDLAVTRAFQEAAPFDPPPPELLRGGAVSLQNLGFTVTIAPMPGAGPR